MKWSLLLVALATLLLFSSLPAGARRRRTRTGVIVSSFPPASPPRRSSVGESSASRSRVFVAAGPPASSRRRSPERESSAPRRRGSGRRRGQVPSPSQPDAGGNGASQQPSGGNSISVGACLQLCSAAERLAQANCFRVCEILSRQG